MESQMTRNLSSDFLGVGWARSPSQHFSVFSIGSPTSEKLENQFRSFDIPSVETQSVFKKTSLLGEVEFIKSFKRSFHGPFVSNISKIWPRHGENPYPVVIWAKAKKDNDFNQGSTHPWSAPCSVRVGAIFLMFYWSWCGAVLKFRFFPRTNWLLCVDPWFQWSYWPRSSNWSFEWFQ